MLIAIPYDTTFTDLDKAKPLSFIFLHVSADQDELSYSVEAISCWTSCNYFWVRFSKAREIPDVLGNGSQNFNVGMHSDIYESNFLQTWCDSRYYWTQHFDASLTDLDLDSRPQECKKVKIFATMIPQTFQSIWLQFGYCLDLLVWQTSYSLDRGARIARW